MPRSRASSPPSSYQHKSRHSHISNASWRSSLAISSPELPAINPPPPMYQVATRTENVPRSANYPPSEEKARENMKSSVDLEAGNGVAPSQARQSRVWSIVDNIVSGIRDNIPRAVTRGQIHERIPSSRFSASIPGATGIHSHMQPPPEIPLLFPPGIPLMPYIDTNITGTCCSMYTGKDDTCNSSGSLSSRIGGFLVELSSMPWISDRVADEYIPGESRSRGSQHKNSTSWYSVRAPASPSEISSTWRKVPDPFLAAPRNLPTTDEEPEPAEPVAGETSHGQEQVRDEVRQLRDEVQTKSREVGDLQQIVDHQKKHIAALEDDLENFKQAIAQSSPELQGRRSSARLYRKRDSVRSAISVRRSVSRPASLLA